MFCGNNDNILRSEGIKKGLKVAVILKETPLKEGKTSTPMAKKEELSKKSKTAR